MKILVSGANGMLGHEVVREFADVQVVETDLCAGKLRLDITDEENARQVIGEEKPDWVINCAAYTSVDECEEKEDLAYTINAKGPGVLAGVCRETGTRLVHISTDYVFDGTSEKPYMEEDRPCPINAYGRTKLAGEKAIIDMMDDFLILRTQWLFGVHGKNFVSTILNLAGERSRIDVVNDQWGSPTYAPDLAHAIRLCMENDLRGIFHVCNSGKASWYDFAREAVTLAGLDTEVVAVDTSRFPRPAKRPANSVLSTEKFRKHTGSEMPEWQAALKDYMACRK